MKRIPALWAFMSIVAVTITAMAAAERQEAFYRDVNLYLNGGLLREDGSLADIELYLGVKLADDGSWQWNKQLMGWAGLKMVGWVVDKKRA